MATVFIWNNNLISNHSVIGHASISINDTWSQVQCASLPSYVSFWPSDDPAGLTSSRHADPFPNVFYDIVIEKYAPDHIIRVNNLDTQKMLAKWSDIRNKKSVHYKFVRKNCATVAGRVLRKGSKKGGLKRHNMVWTPLDVKRLALDLGGVQLTWDSFVDEMYLAGAVDDIGSNALKAYKRRQQSRGSSQAIPRRVNGKDTGGTSLTLSSLKFSEAGADLVIND